MSDDYIDRKRIERWKEFLEKKSEKSATEIGKKYDHLTRGDIYPDDFKQKKFNGIELGLHDEGNGEA